MLRNEPSGNIFGLTQNAGMGWRPDASADRNTSSSARWAACARSRASRSLGYHTGHWEIGLLVRGAAEALRAAGACRSPSTAATPATGERGTTGMFDSLAYRNDAAIVMRRLIRSLPTASGVLGIATCDKGLPAAMLALAGTKDLPGVIVPGARYRHGMDAGQVQSLGARFAHDLDQPRLRGGDGLQGVRIVRRRLPVPGHRRSVAGDRRSAGAGAAAQRWRRRANRCGSSSRHARPQRCGVSTAWAFDRPAAHQRGNRERDARARRVRRFDQSAPARAGDRRGRGLKPPSVDDWIRVNRATPRLVDALPNGPRGFAAQVFMAGGVPE